MIEIQFEKQPVKFDSSWSYIWPRTYPSRHKVNTVRSQANNLQIYDNFINQFLRKNCKTEKNVISSGNLCCPTHKADTFIWTASDRLDNQILISHKPAYATCSKRRKRTISSANMGQMYAMALNYAILRSNGKSVMTKNDMKIPPPEHQHRRTLSSKPIESRNVRNFNSGK